LFWGRCNYFFLEIVKKNWSKRRRKKNWSGGSYGVNIRREFIHRLVYEFWMQGLSYMIWYHVHNDFWPRFHFCKIWDKQNWQNFMWNLWKIGNFVKNKQYTNSQQNPAKGCLIWRMHLCQTVRRYSGEMPMV